MKIGDKVVCVDDSACRCGCNGLVPVKSGSVYVIRELFTRKDGILTIALVGIFDFSDKHWQRNDVFALRRFRLLDDMKKEAGERNKKDLGRHNIKAYVNELFNKQIEDL